LLLLLLVVVVVVGLPAPHRALYLAQNQLSGDFPDAISVLTNLKELGLWSNRSEGGGVSLAELSCEYGCDEWYADGANPVL
jgi:hypothetical protein